jgi:DNA-binding NtrC family response regulator
VKTSSIRILVVDDERGLCAGVQEALRREGYQVDAANDASAALKLLDRHLYNLVLSDIRMPGLSGLELLKTARARHRDTQFILMTAYGTVDSAVEAMKAGAHDYVTKPLDMHRLRTQVLKALEYQALVAENHELRQRLRSEAGPTLLLGDSPALQRVRQTIEEVARTDVTVLIEGESGTGKELAARLIHQRSERAGKPFVAVNCAALPETLLEAELFGHVKGAFTGAVATRAGRFQQADGGTLFLDEIGDLSAKGQGDLLRVLDDGCFRMVGSAELTQANVRIVAATNKRLTQTVASGHFREDLLYRLQVIPLSLPPLRDRPEDLPLLAASFLAHFAARHHRQTKRLDDDALRRCQRFAWPGNVRQFRNTLERLVLTCPHAVIGVADLPDFLRAAAAPDTIRPGVTLAEAEKLLIQQTLAQVTDNRAAAARALGISRRTLQYKLKQYRLLDAPQASPNPPRP